jgi:hypothetical protein
MEIYIFLLFFEVGKLILESKFSNTCSQQFFSYSLDKLKNQEYPFEDDS